MVAIRSSSTEGQQTSAEPQEHESHGIDPDGVDADLEPSADWGWHGSFPVGSRVAGWITVLIMFGMVFFSHTGFGRPFWLLAMSVALLVALIADLFKRRSNWRS